MHLTKDKRPTSVASLRICEILMNSFKYLFERYFNFASRFPITCHIMFSVSQLFTLDARLWSFAVVRRGGGCRRLGLSCRFSSWSRYYSLHPFLLPVPLHLRLTLFATLKQCLFCFKSPCAWSLKLWKNYSKPTLQPRSTARNASRRITASFGIGNPTNVNDANL